MSAMICGNLKAPNIKSCLHNGGVKLKGAERIINTLVFSEEDSATMTRFASTPIKCLTERGGKDLIEMVKHSLKY